VRYLMIYRPAPRSAAMPSAEHMATMDRYIEDQARRGILLTTGGLKPGRRSVRLASGELTVVDGPFAEAKEIIGGFAICELPSWEAAVASAEEFLKLAGDGTTEVHEMYSPEEFGKEPVKPLVENEKRLQAELTGPR
jgi:hypothetical protein